MKTTLIATLATVVLMTGALPIQAQSGHDLFQQALVTERANGQLLDAIALYGRITEEFASDRELVAMALVQMGRCYEKLGNEDAQRAYRRVVQEYPDQTDLADEASARLAALNRANRTAEAASITTRLVLRERDADWFAITPDGRHAVLTAYESGDLALRDIVSGEIRFLTDDASWDDPWQLPWGATVSPDGRLVAYNWSAQDERLRIRLVGTDGLGSRVLYADQTCAVRALDWSSDGESLLAGRNCDYEASSGGNFQLVLLSVRDSTARLLKDFGRRAFGGSRAFSPDDQYVVYDLPDEADNEMRDVWVMAADGSSDIPIVQHPANDRLLGWAPGTDDVLFLSDRDGTWDVWAVTVVSGRAQGAPQLLHRNIGEVAPIGFTPDGGLFYQAYTRWWSTSVAPYDAASGTVAEESAVAIRGSNMNVAWSPEGRYLALVGEEHGPGGPGFDYRRPLRIHDLTTGDEREVGRLEHVRRPNWSPDGRSILINARDEARQDEGYHGGLYLIDVQSGEVSHVLDVPDGAAWWRGFQAQWSADGASILYAAYNEDAREGRLVWRELTTGTERELYRDSCLAARIIDLHPDGTHLLFGLRDKPSANVFWIQGSGRLMVLDLETGDLRELLGIQDSGLVRSVEWAPDGSHVLYAIEERNKGTELWRVAATGGEPEMLYTFAEDQFGGYFTFSPDGRQIALVVYSQEYEIWQMENLREVLERWN